MGALAGLGDDLPDLNDLFDAPTPEIEPAEERGVQVYKTTDRHRLRRLKSEAALERALDWHFSRGEAYHCVSFGDVDSLSYLRHVLRQEPLQYVVLSTWCMAKADVLELGEWIGRGLITRADFYVGEIFQASYSEEWLMLAELAASCGGRAAIFRNHSKVMLGFGRSFDVVIESSANVNTNPRCENTTVTVDAGLARFYKKLYDAIISFDKSFPDWQPYELKPGKRG
jgi:hypothetical protein